MHKVWKLEWDDYDTASSHEEICKNTRFEMILGNRETYAASVSYITQLVTHQSIPLKQEQISNEKCQTSHIPVRLQYLHMFKLRSQNIYVLQPQEADEPLLSFIFRTNLYLKT